MRAKDHKLFYLNYPQINEVGNSYHVVHTWYGMNYFYSTADDSSAFSFIEKRGWMGGGCPAIQSMLTFDQLSIENVYFSDNRTNIYALPSDKLLPHPNY